MKKKLKNKKKIDGTPSKNELKDMQKRHKVQNKKYPNARSVLERPGGVANIYGCSINNAFFNRAMGGKVSQDEFEPSPTGLAVDIGDITVSAGADTGAGEAGGDVGGDIGGDVGGGDMGGGMGESLTPEPETIDIELNGERDLNGKFHLNITDEILKLLDSIPAQTAFEDEEDYEGRLWSNLYDKYHDIFSADAIDTLIRDYMKNGTLSKIEIIYKDISEDNNMGKKIIKNDACKLCEEENAEAQGTDAEVQSAKQAANVILDALKEKKDNASWIETAQTVIQNTPDSAIRTIWDNFKRLFASIKLGDQGDQIVKKTADETGDEDLINVTANKKFGSIKEMADAFDGTNFVNEHPDKVKPLILSIMGVISIAEPTLIGELITAIIAALPENVVAKLVKVLMSLNVIKLLVVAVDGIIKKIKKEELQESFGDDEELYFKAFITNLGKYNEGELVGEYVEFPIDEDDFEEKLKEIGIGSTDEFGQPYEEWFVTDYETNTGISLGEYVSYDELNKIGEMVENINDQHLAETFQNAIEALGDYDIESIAEGVIDGDIIFYDGITTDSDLGYELIEEVYGNDIPKDLIESYFDFEALGRDLRLEYYAEDEEDPETAGEYWCGDENASDSDIGWAYYDAVGGEVSNPENYFDYEAYGRDCSFDGFTFTKDGCIWDRR